MTTGACPDTANGSAFLSFSANGPPDSRQLTADSEVATLAVRGEQGSSSERRRGGAVHASELPPRTKRYSAVLTRGRDTPGRSGCWNTRTEQRMPTPSAPRLSAREEVRHARDCENPGNGHERVHQDESGDHAEPERDWRTCLSRVAP